MHNLHVKFMHELKFYCFFRLCDKRRNVKIREATEFSVLKNRFLNSSASYHILKTEQVIQCTRFRMFHLLYYKGYSFPKYFQNLISN